jgi:anti-sigma factor RsiW
MTCQHAIDLLDDYVDESLGPRDRWRLRLHLWCCRNCRRYLSSYKTTVHVAKQAFADQNNSAHAEPPESMVAAILAAGPGR